jgi:D-alanyl-D-alanine carboxypeptidase
MVAYLLPLLHTVRIMNSVAMQHAVGFLDNWLAFRSRQVDIPGFVVSVYHEGKEVFGAAYGMADVALGIPMNTSHLFGVASQSKMITATAILQLIAAGKLRLDDTVVDHLPWLAKHPDPRIQDVTIRHLLSHSTGLVRDDSQSDYWQGKTAFPSAAAIKKTVLSAELVLETNLQMKYSNLGFGLLGQVITAVSGQSYAKYVAERITKPLQLKHFSADWAPSIGPGIALGYTVPHNQKRDPVETTMPMRALAPAGGCFASPSDMCRLVAAHFRGNGRLLPDALKNEAHKSHWVITRGYDQGYEYGLGFEVMELAGRRLVGHGGSLLGYRTATFFDPGTRLAVSVAANCKDAPALSMLRGVFQALFHFEDTASDTTPAYLSRFNARVHSPMASLQVVATKGAIVAMDPDDWEPFSWSEQLSRLDNRTLQVVTLGSIHAKGERAVFDFEDEQVSRLKFGGLTLETSSRHTAEDTPEPYSLPYEESDVLFLHHLNRSRQQFFRLEVLADYDTDLEESSDSLQAWLQGNTNKAIGLLERLRTHKNEQRWLQAWPHEVAQKQRAIRVRLVDGDFTPFMRWELEHFKRINIPLCSEQIYYLPKKYLGTIVPPTGDLIMCDDMVVANRYQGNKLTHRTFYDRHHPETQRLIALNKQILQLALQYQTPIETL